MATRDLSQNSNKVVKQTERILTATEKGLVKSYTVALADVRSEIARLYDAYNVTGAFTKAEATKFMRLSNIEQSIADIMRPYLGANKELIGNAAAASFDNGFFTTAWSMDQATGVSIGYGSINENAVSAAVGIGGDPGELEQLLGKGVAEKHQRLLDKAFTNYDKDTQKWISQDIRQGVIQGESVPEITKRLRKNAFVKSYNSAERIARTETLRAQSVGSQIAYDEARDAGVVVKETWDATLDDRTRPDHAEADGTVKDPETGLFSVPWGDVQGPRLSGIAEQDINCFPGHVSVKGINIEGAYKRMYSGKVYIIKTAGKLDITVTPNHPILTTEGWVKAGAIKPGDYVVNMPRAELRDIQETDVNDMPSLFQEVYDFLSIRGTSLRQPGIDKQFHGDGGTAINTGVGKTDVDIVTLDSHLLDTSESSIDKHLEEGDFPFTKILFSLFPGLGTLNEFYDGAFFTKNSLMSFLSECEAFIRSQFRHSDKVSFGSGSALEAKLAVITGDSATGYAETLRCSIARFAEMISFDEIIGVTESVYDGHVYNLQTKSGWYIVSNNDESVNGIVVHNCRCNSVPSVEGFTPELRRVRGEGLQPYQTFKTWATEKGMTVNRFGQELNF